MEGDDMKKRIIVEILSDVTPLQLEGSMAKLAATNDDGPRPKEVRRATAELVVS